MKTHAKNALIGMGAASFVGEGTMGAVAGYLLGGTVGAIGGYLGSAGMTGLSGQVQSGFGGTLHG